MLTARTDEIDKIVGLSVGADDYITCLLYTSDAADERSSVDLGGRRIIKKKNITNMGKYSYKQTVDKTEEGHAAQ